MALPHLRILRASVSRGPHVDLQRLRVTREYRTTIPPCHHATVQLLDTLLCPHGAGAGADANADDAGD